MTDSPSDWLTVRLTGWLAGWLTDLLANWLTDELTDWPTECRLINWLTDWLTNWLTDRLLTDWMTDWRTDCRLIDGPTADWSTDRLTDRLQTDQLTDWRTDCRLTNWLTDWLTAHWLLTDCSLTTWPTNCQNISQKPPTRNAIGFCISMQSFSRIRYAANSISLTCNTYVCVSPTKQTKVCHSLFIYAFSNLSLTTYLF